MALFRYQEEESQIPASSLTVALTCDVYGRLKTKITAQMKQTYVYDNASGNLLPRDYRLSGSSTGLTSKRYPVQYKSKPMHGKPIPVCFFPALDDVLIHRQIPDTLIGTLPEFNRLIINKTS